MDAAGRNPGVPGQIPPGARGVVGATMALSKRTGLPPAIVLAHGVPAIAAARRMSPDRLLDECGIPTSDALRAGLHLPQPEFLTHDPAVCCRCAGGPRTPMGDLGALVLGGIFDDVTSIFGGGGEGTPISGTYDPGTDPPKTPPAMSDGWPAAVAFRPGNWDFDLPTYTIAQGDTLSGISRRYLGAPNRWLEIWALQSYRYTLKPDPSSKNPGRGIQQGDVLVMPYEARDEALKLMKTTPATPATPGAPGTKPNAVNGLSPTAPGAETFVANHKGLLIAGGVVVVAGLAYAATR